MSVISEEEKKNENYSHQQEENLKPESKLSVLTDNDIIIKKKESQLEKIKENNKKEKSSSVKNIPIITNNIENKTNTIDSYSIEEKDIVFSIDKSKKSPETMFKSIIDIDSTEREIINKLPEKKNVLFQNNNNSIYKYCITWSHIPLITFLFPFIGHCSIVNSYGFIHDFDSSNFIKIYNENENGFSKIVYLNLDDNQKKIWDNVIEKIDKNYKKKSFSMCGNNSFKYISNILNNIEYKGKKNYTKCDIFWLIIKEGKFISKCDLFKTYFGLIIIVFIVVFIIIISH